MFIIYSDNCLNVSFYSKAAEFGASIEGKASKASQIQVGQLLPNSSVIFEKSEGSSLNLIGKSKG